MSPYFAEDEALRQSWEKTRKVVEAAANSPRIADKNKFTEVTVPMSEPREPEGDQSHVTEAKSPRLESGETPPEKSQSDGQVKEGNAREDEHDAADEDAPQTSKNHTAESSKKADRPSEEGSTENSSSDDAAALVPEKSGGQDFQSHIRPDPDSLEPGVKESDTKAESIPDAMPDQVPPEEKPEGNQQSRTGETESAECCPEAEAVPVGAREAADAGGGPKDSSSPSSQHRGNSLATSDKGSGDLGVPQDAEESLQVHGNMIGSDVDSTQRKGQDKGTAEKIADDKFSGLTSPSPEKSKLPPPTHQVKSLARRGCQ